MEQKVLTLLFLRRDDEVLLAMKKRGFGEGKWNGVGGKLDEDETVAEALVREAQEEVGVTPIGYEKVADMEFNEIHVDKRKILHVMAYLCITWQGEPVESEEMKPQWFPISDIPYEEMWDEDQLWLPLVMAGKKIKAKFIHDDHDTVIDHQIEEVAGF